MTSSRVPVLLCIVLLVGGPVFACKYSVRDVAFVNLGDAPYRLYVLIDAKTPADVRRHIATAAPATLLDTNIGHEIVEVDRSREHPASRRAATLGVSAPALLLLASDDRALTLPLCDADGRHTEDSVWDALRAVTTSTARSEIMKHCLTHHSIVLLVGGSDEAAWTRAGRLAVDAVREIEQGLADLPKPMKHGPQVLTITAAQRSSERVLLWSLGIEDLESADTFIVPLMGRGRRLGPSFRVPGATVMELTENLAVAGQDCECGLDRSWMQGAMIPHSWSMEEDARALEVLGFDPGDPMVRSEMARILSRGGKKIEQRAESRETREFTYGEVDVEIADEAEQAIQRSIDNSFRDHPRVDVNRTIFDLDDRPIGPERKWQTYAPALIVVAVLLIAGGLVVVFVRGRPKR